MTDLELLELAAKASGVEYDAKALAEHKEGRAFFGLWLVCHDEPYEGQRRYWNPLTNDGDALRLAVKLRIDFYTGNDDGEASYAGFFDPKLNNRQHFAIERHEESNPYAATRRAIVRAAATNSIKEQP